MWPRLIAWLGKTAPEEPPQQRVDQLIIRLRSPDRSVRIRAEQVVARGLADYTPSEAEFLIALLAALSREFTPERLELVPRYILLLASGSIVGPRKPVQAAAEACLAHWQSLKEERERIETLLRASEPPGGAEILLRPASGQSPVVPEEHLRPGMQEPEDPSTSL